MDLTKYIKIELEHYNFDILKDLIIFAKNDEKNMYFNNKYLLIKIKLEDIKNNCNNKHDDGIFIEKIINKTKRQILENNYNCSIFLLKKNKTNNENIIEKQIINDIIYYSEIYNDIKRGIFTFENKIKIILDEKKLKDARTNRRKYKNMIIRSWYLYNKYENKLNNIYFNLGNMSVIYDINWNKWLDILDKFIINNITDKDNMIYSDKEVYYDCE